MPRRTLFPVIFGIAGAAILIWLGVWQLQRLAWKEAVLARIDESIHAPPADLPAKPEEARDNYRRVRVTGRLGAAELHVLTSRSGLGPGYRIIAPLDLSEGRRILLDRGFVPEAEKDSARAAGAITVTGSLHWPRETDSFTPEPNHKRNIWFARDVDAMARELSAEPVLVVVAESSIDDGVLPEPVTVNIRNVHLQYAITWFSLAAAWIGMTAYLLWRIKQRTI
ncbi:MAG: SURF1 family protein [Paracoccaceae bacterium]